MIIVSDDVDLATEDGDVLGTPWIGYHNVLQSGSITATTEEADNPASNLANPATHLFWRGEVNTGDEYLTMVTNYTGNLNYVGVAKHNFFTANITVTVEGRNGSSPDIWQTLVDAITLDDDLPVIFRFPLQVLTDIRLRLQINSDIYPQAAVLYVGELLVLERSLELDTEHVPITYGRRSTVVSGMSESGNFLGRTVLREWRETKAVFHHFTPTWYRTYFDPFIVQSKETPFFFCWDTDVYPAETGFAWMTNDPEPETSLVTDRINVDLQMRGIA